MLYCIFLWGENIGILYSAIKAELCSVQFYELSVVLILVQLKWTKMHFIVNYWSSQFTSKVLSKRLLMNSICNLCWVFSKHPGRMHFYFLDAGAFHAWRIHLQSGIPPKSRQLGSYGESGRTYTPAHVDLQAIISTPWVSTVKQRTLKPAIKLF